MQHQARATSENRLLAALPGKISERLRASGKVVELNFSEVLARPGDRIRHVYFPLDCYISLLASVGSYATLGVGLIGREGMFGTALMHGVNVAPLHAFVQGAGSALRMNAWRFRGELEHSPALRLGLNRYLHVITQQLVNMATCAHFHVVEARLARWLLMTRDRALSNKFYLTQDFLSHMLGVRRVGVSEAARALQKRKLIRYSRGNIAILDLRALRASACVCYLNDTRTYNRILS